MIGSVIGDIAGSTYEFIQCKDYDFDLFPINSTFTDDSILTVATCEVLLKHGDYAKAYHAYGNRFPNPMGGYGMRFANWLTMRHPVPYDSYGNGSAMRAGPIGVAFSTVEDVLVAAEASAKVTHSHAEGIKGAQATALAVHLAFTGKDKEFIRNEVAHRFQYDLFRSASEVRKHYVYNESCQGTVPEAIIAFLDSKDYESAIRLSISMGGDADTMGCITGGIAHAYYRSIPDDFIERARAILPADFTQILADFHQTHGLAG